MKVMLQSSVVRRTALVLLAALLLGVIVVIAVLPAQAQTTNLALNRPVTCSSTENASFPCANAVDGNTGTRWSSAFSDPQWIYVDLGATTSISRVVLNWEAAYGRSYQIQVSGSSSGPWTSIYSTTTGNGGADDLTVSGSGRYVRMYGTVRATPYGYSLFEFQVYGGGTPPPPTTPPPTTAPPPSGNLALNKPVTFSNQQAGNEAYKAVDGSTTTRWAGSPWPQWIQVDLGATYTINRTELMPYSSRAYRYRIEVATNGSTFTTVVDKTGNTTGGATLVDTFANVSARYVRLTTTGASGYTGGWVSYYEFRVFGSGTPLPTTPPPPDSTPSPTTPAPTTPPPTTPPGWNLVWSDEFNGPSVDTSSWSFQTGCTGWGNGEWEDYTSGANTSFQTDSRVGSSVLVIEARMKPGATLGNCGMTSTRMNTSGKRSWLYGRMEARLAVPMGQGVWPAFWMMGNTGGWPSNGEIDIMEHINSTSTLVGTLHWNDGGHRSSGTSVTVPNMTEYHVYGIEWDANQIRFFWDNNYYNTISITSIPQPAFHQASYFLLNLAIGGQWPGYPTSTNIFPARYYIDYVRVYQH